jgi:pimeloyl-ACP methyl ester carboxylesterase
LNFRLNISIYRHITFMTTTLLTSATKTKTKPQNKPLNHKQSLSPSKVWVNGQNLYFETFGNPKDPAVLLIAGIGSQCLHWFPYFYQPIVAQGFYVIRFDHRDVGLSEWTDHQDWRSQPYTIEDMAKDAIGLLDRLNIAKAHIIGACMGGMIAQSMAINYPTYVRSLTSMLSAAEASNFKLKSCILSAFDTSMPSLPLQLQSWALLAGSRFGFDAERYVELYDEAYKVRKGYNPHCFSHHLTAIQLSPSRLSELGKIRVPALIVHGTEDPLIPEAHASVYAQQIPQATYLALDGVGHEMPKGIAPTVLETIFNLFSKT